MLERKFARYKEVEVFHDSHVSPDGDECVVFNPRQIVPLLLFASEEFVLQ
jgi:hypothetical protein